MKRILAGLFTAIIMCLMIWTGLSRSPSTTAGFLLRVVLLPGGRRCTALFNGFRGMIAAAG